MRRIIYLLFIVLTVQSCSPGIKVESKLSDSYFYQPVSFLIIYSPNGNWFELDYRILSTTPWSFKVLSEDVGKNNNAVFYKYHKQTTGDIESFTVTSKVIKDKNFVYTVSESKFIPIEGADPKTFIYLEPNSVNQIVWGKDKSRYYFHDTPVSVDYNTFEFINDQYFYDKDSIYRTYNTRIEGIDISHGNLIPISESYSKNKDTIFYFGYDRYLKFPIFSSDSIFIISETTIRIGDKTINDGNIEITDKHEKTTNR